MENENQMEEKTLWKGNPSQILNLKVFVLCGLVFFALLTLMIYSVTNSKWHAPSYLTSIMTGLLAVPLGIAFWKFLKLKCRIYELTTERIHMTHGILSKQIDDLELYRVKDTTLLEPFFLRLFSRGNIILHTSDRTDPLFVLEAVADPEQLRNLIRKNVETCRVKKRVGEIDVDEHIV